LIYCVSIINIGLIIIIKRGYNTCCSITKTFLPVSGERPPMKGQVKWDFMKKKSSKFSD